MHLNLSSGISVGLSKQVSYKCPEELLHSGNRAPHSHCEEIKSKRALVLFTTLGFLGSFTGNWLRVIFYFIVIMLVLS